VCSGGAGCVWCVLRLQLLRLMKQFSTKLIDSTRQVERKVRGIVVPRWSAWVGYTHTQAAGWLQLISSKIPEPRVSAHSQTGHVRVSSLKVTASPRDYLPPESGRAGSD